MVVLTPERRAILTAQLAEAEQALHDLVVGQKEVSAGVDGHTITYTPAKEANLRAHIASLRRQLSLSGGRRRAMRVRF